MKHCNRWLLRLAQEIETSWPCVSDYADHIGTYQATVRKWLIGSQMPSMGFFRSIELDLGIKHEDWWIDVDESELRSAVDKLTSKALITKAARALGKARDRRNCREPTDGSRALAKVDATLVMDRIGATRAQYDAWASGRIRPSLNTRLRLEDLAGIPVGSWHPKESGAALGYTPLHERHQAVRRSNPRRDHDRTGETSGLCGVAKHHGSLP